MNSQSTASSKGLLFSSLGSKVFFGLMFMALMLVASFTRIEAQRVYGVASRTTVVHTGSGTVVHKSTAVAVRPGGLCCGYIAVLPGGYRAIGGGIYMAGSVRYRATFYQGRTVYIRL